MNSQNLLGKYLTKITLIYCSFLYINEKKLFSKIGFLFLQSGELQWAREEPIKVDAENFNSHLLCINSICG